MGESIEAAVRATRDAAGCNTNLGIVLLCVPLARAWQASGADSPDRLLATLAPGLAALDLADAEAAYRAIAVASPGGLGQAPAEDVADAPSVDLRAAMTLGRDSVARQYRDGFADILGFGIGEFLAAGACEATLGDAVQRLHTAFLARWPDSHIVRKLGGGVAQDQGGHIERG